MTHQVPTLWAYFAIAQILPTSFSQNLFCLALQLQSPRIGARRPWSSWQDYTLKAAVGLFMLAVIYAPRAADTGWIIPLVLLARLLLLAPYLILSRPMPFTEKSPGDPNDPTSVYEKSAAIYRPITGFVAAMLVVPILVSAISNNAFPVQSLAWALSSSHAVGAIGYDFIVGVLSCAIYIQTE